MKKAAFRRGFKTFSDKHKNGKSALARRNEKLNSKLADMREVISWLTEENLQLLKNELGELSRPGDQRQHYWLSGGA